MEFRTTMARGVTPAWICFGILLVGMTGVGCESYEPRILEPLPVYPLEEPVLDGILAVTTLIDKRPSSERGDEAVEHAMDLDPFFPRTPYWGFRPGVKGNLEPASDRALGGVRARYTGADSFRWFEFPWVGSSAPEERRPAAGLSDYLAAVLSRRNIAERVVRAPNSSKAEGVDFILQGSVRHFAGIFAEDRVAPDPYQNFGYGFRLAGWTALELTLVSVESGEVLWSDQVDHMDDLLTMDEGIETYHPRARERTFGIWADHFSQWAHEAMQEHAERSLHATVIGLLDRLETNFGGLANHRTMPSRVIPPADLVAESEPVGIDLDSLPLGTSPFGSSIDIPLFPGGEGDIDPLRGLLDGGGAGSDFPVNPFDSESLDGFPQDAGVGGRPRRGGGGGGFGSGGFPRRGGPPN